MIIWYLDPWGNTKDATCKPMPSFAETITCNSFVLVGLRALSSAVIPGPAQTFQLSSCLYGHLPQERKA